MPKSKILKMAQSKATVKEWCVFDQSIAKVVDKSIKFNGKTYKSDIHKTFIVLEVLSSLPTVNLKRRAFTAATLANSYRSMQHQLADFEHRLKFYGRDEDAVCGAVVDVEYPSKKKAQELASDGDPVPVKLLAVVWHKIERVHDMLADLKDDASSWSASMECGYRWSDAALWDGDKFYPLSEISEEMAELIKPHTVEDWDGKKMTLVLGGADGEVAFSGFGFTELPADPTARINQTTASKPEIEVNAGWADQSDWLEAAASVNSSEQEQGAMVIGRTDPAADGHTHPITRNLQILPANDHTHYLQPVDYDPATGVLEGMTSSHYTYLRNEERSSEHAHTVHLGVAQEETSRMPIIGKEELSMKKGQIKALRATANAIRKDNPEAAKQLDDAVSEIEKEQEESSVEAVVAERIKSGDLVPKADYEAGLEAARKEGEEKAEKRRLESEKAEKERREAIAARLKKIDEADLDANFVLAKDRTLKTVAEGLPVSAEGEQEFADRLEEWKNLSKNTGQMKKSKQENASANGDVKPPFGSDESGETANKKPGRAFL